jgi:hypothetical protein
MQKNLIATYEEYIVSTIDNKTPMCDFKLNKFDTKESADIGSREYIITDIVL